MIKPKYTPAITIVELCKRAEIGVGADIAFKINQKKGIELISKRRSEDRTIIQSSKASKKNNQQKQK